MYAFVVIALAVAVGVALAPLVPWVVLAVVLFLAACVALALTDRAWKRISAVLFKGFCSAADFLNRP